MLTRANSPIEEYIKQCDRTVQPRLRRLHSIVHKAAPDAEEHISYRMPAFRLGRIFLYFATFKNHIGAFPPVRGNAALEKAFKKYMGPKGNLQFPHDQPVPYSLIERLVKHRVKLERARLQAKPSERRQKTSG